MLRKIADIKLGPDDFQLAKNGGPHCLTYCGGVDPYGVPYHYVVEAKSLDPDQVACPIDLLGEKETELQKMRAAVGRGGEV